MVFFFQAEDGIRDLVRSRGLGDVYKRQVLRRRQTCVGILDHEHQVMVIRTQGILSVSGPDAVSYTHLTLPTSDLV